MTTYTTVNSRIQTRRDAFDPQDFAENPLKYELFSTAYCKAINAYCSLKQIDREGMRALCNFGWQDVWTPLQDLSRFVL